MKLFVKLRESGDVREVYIIARASEGVYYADVWGIDDVQYIGKDCDLCDEQGRLLKPEYTPKPDKRIGRAIASLQGFRDATEDIDCDVMGNSEIREQIDIVLNILKEATK